MKTTGNLGLKKPEGTDLVDIADLNGNMDILDNAVTGKVDKVTGKQLSTNDYTTAEKTKLAGIATGATNYTHPETHPPSIIAQDASNRFVTDTEKAAWNGKAPNTLVSGALQNDGLMRATDKLKLDGIAAGANNYVHPATHPATMITEDATHRFATDTEKSNWNGKPNLSTTPQQTTADITYYVRTDGSDSNNGLANTAAGAFKTIGKAISMVPSVVNHVVTINVAAGAYNENVTVAGYSGRGLLTISGDTVASTSRSVTTITVYRNSIQTTVKGFNLTTTTETAVYVEGSVNVIFQYLNIVGAAKGLVGIQVHSSKAYVNLSVISNRLLAFQSTINGEIVADNNAGTGNTNAGNAVYGGRVSLYSAKPSGINEAAAGGIIFDGGSVINPWGDNTTDQRPTVWAYMSTAFVISTTSWTSLKYGGVNSNHGNGYNATTGEFTAPQTGFYRVKMQILIPTVPPNQNIMIGILFNVAIRYMLDSRSSSPAGSSDLMLGGDITMRLNAGDKLIPQILVGSSLTPAIGQDTTHFEVIRIS
ncbi:pectinesterase family protein [Paenibacillus sp. B2(2019)]|uniref:pectinesterase family protein n=1 Tax=Paenibacillus sp. B2(2019) TaxID=2607754 RepID=UPI0011F2BF90|nr:pectinesterase family protein [Paenibacillus sp. B2(2019)]KAA1180706.1 hypothetical protein PAENI_26005 [Paenibacillus sp. B2(2019)]